MKIVFLILILSKLIDKNRLSYICYNHEVMHLSFYVFDSKNAISATFDIWTEIQVSFYLIKVDDFVKLQVTSYLYCISSYTKVSFRVSNLVSEGGGWNYYFYQEVWNAVIIPLWHLRRHLRNKTVSIWLIHIVQILWGLEMLDPGPLRGVCVHLLLS